MALGLKVENALGDFAHSSGFTERGGVIIDLDGTTSVTCDTLGTYTPGKELSILNFSISVSDWAIRFAGNLTADAGFLALMDNTIVNGGAAA